MKPLFALILLLPFLAFGQETASLQFKTVADMVDYSIPTNNSRLSAIVSGRKGANDGGGGVFIYDSSSSATTNLSVVFKPSWTTGRWIRIAGSVSDILWTGTITNQKMGVNVPSEALKHVFEVRGGSIPVGTHSIYSTGTLTNSASDQYGNYFNMTGAGNGAGSQYAARFELGSGYTGNVANFALRAVNNTDGSGGNLNNANFGLNGVSHGSSASSTTIFNVGTHGQARWAPVSIGVWGLGTYQNGVTFRLGQQSVGVYGIGDADSTGKKIGGAFMTGGANLSFTASAAVLADVDAITVPVFLGRSMGTNRFYLTGTGRLGINADPDTTGYTLDILAPASAGNSTFDVVASLGKPSTHQSTFQVRVKDMVVDLAALPIVRGGGANNALSFSTTPDGGSPTEAIAIDKNQNITIDKGNLTLATAGKKLQIKEGADASMGVATLNGGTHATVAVSTTAVTANSRIFLTVQNAAALFGNVVVSSRTAGKSFTITSSLAGDTNNVAWVILEPAS